MHRDAAMSAKIADGSVLWLRAGDLITVRFGEEWGTQLARVVDPGRADRGRVKVMKYRARSKRWTQPVTESTARILGRHEEG